MPFVGESENSEAIVLWKKKRKDSTEFFFLTKEKGILSSTLSNNRLKSLKGFSYLQPFASVIITFLKEKEYYKLLQVDGRFTVPRLEVDLNHIAYTAMVGELLRKAFHKEQRDLTLYRLVEAYAKALLVKPIPLASLIVGWQLLSQAGFMPDAKHYQEKKAREAFLQELYATTGISLLSNEEVLLGEILAYTWTEKEVLHLTRQGALHLEVALYAYSKVQIGEDLESLDFIKTVKASLFSEIG